MFEPQIIYDYLPISLNSPTEVEYYNALTSAYEINREHKNHQFAYMSYHMLFMSYIYTKLWQYRETYPDKFRFVLIGFNYRDEMEIRADTSLFSLSKINETQTAKLLKLLKIEDCDVIAVKKRINRRNELAHANGNVYFKSQKTLDDELREIISCISFIQQKAAETVQAIYLNFLLSSKDKEQREYFTDEEQINELLIKKWQFSRADLSQALSIDLTKQRSEKGYANIEQLHQTLKEVV